MQRFEFVGYQNRVSNTLYIPEQGELCYLEVSYAGNKPEKKTAAFAFDGWDVAKYAENGERFVWEAVKTDLDKNGPYHLQSRIQPTRKYRYLSKHLYLLYTGREFANKDVHPLQIRNPITIHGCEDFGFFEQRGVDVFDFSRQNICDVGDYRIFTGSRSIYTDRDQLYVISQDRIFFTQRNEWLRKLFSSVRTYKVVVGGLKLDISNTKTSVSFAELIWAYDNGFVHDAEITDETISTTHKWFSERKIEVDHLTNSPSNNHPCLLAAMPMEINRSLGNRRSRIKEPFYFYTAKDRNTLEYKVLCGQYGAPTDAWKAKISFGDFCDRGNAEAYVECFNEFAQIAKEGNCLTTRPAEGNLLKRYADISYIDNPHNPLYTLPDEPLEDFSQWEPGIVRAASEI